MQKLCTETFERRDQWKKRSAWQGVSGRSLGYGYPVCFSILPDLMHCVQTVTLLVPCAEVTRTRCRLGSHTLRVLF